MVSDPKWMIKKARKKEKVTQNLFLGYLGLDPIYKCYVYFTFNILFLSYISALFLLALYENGISIQGPKS